MALETVGAKGLVVGVDLQRVEPLEGAKFVQGDMTKEGVVAEILGLMPRADCVISDVSPELSGNYSMDQARSVHLSTMALELAVKVLRKGGNFVTKVFEGEDIDELSGRVAASFGTLKRHHPRASRAQSSEVYVIGRSFRGAAGEPVP